MIASLLKLNEDWESHGDMRLYFTKVYSIWYSWPLYPVWVMRMVKPWSEYKEEQIGQMMIYTDSLVGAVTSCVPPLGLNGDSSGKGKRLDSSTGSATYPLLEKLLDISVPVFSSWDPHHIPFKVL